MSKTPFFTEGEPADRAYTNVMAASNEWTNAGRKLCEDLWDDFEPYADAEFLIEVRTRFDERFWEMYLSVTLMRRGYELTCSKPGPDVGIIHDGRRIWFEAVSPSRGSDGAPDQVPELKYDGQVVSVPNERIILRYLNSISEKYERQRANWLRSGSVSNDDAFVIALNPRRLGFDNADTMPPRILQAAFPIGNAFITISRDTLETVGSGYHFRPQVQKAGGSSVDTGVFLHEGYQGLSGLLVSRVDVVNNPPKLGEDFQMVHNPVAAVPLPTSFRLPGTYFEVIESGDEYSVRPEPPTGQ